MKVFKGLFEISYTDDQGVRRVLGRFDDVRVVYTRQLVPLAPSETLDPGLLDPDVPGMRLETDDELRARIKPPERLEGLHDMWCDFPKCAGPCNCALADVTPNP